MIWPGRVLQAKGYDVTIIDAHSRNILMNFDENGQLVAVGIDPSYDVVVFQRVTDRRVLQVIPYLRDRGQTVVVDVDDDLSAIHPNNPAFTALNPQRPEHETRLLLRQGKIEPKHVGVVINSLRKQYAHSWENLALACRYASYVTISTPALRHRYGKTGRQGVVKNYLADHYYEVDHQDSELIGWPAAFVSHPNDPAAIGNAVRRMIQDGAEFMTIGDNEGVGPAFGLTTEPAHIPQVDLERWPEALAKIGIGIVPLADTRFNSGKSWLKGLELAAVGVPFVASPRIEYRELHRQGAGVLAKDPRDWYRTLTRLRQSAAYRDEISAAGREAANKLRLRNNADIWWLTWERARQLDLTEGPQSERNKIDVDRIG